MKRHKPDEWRDRPSAEKIDMLREEITGLRRENDLMHSMIKTLVDCLGDPSAHDMNILAGLDAELEALRRKV